MTGSADGLDVAVRSRLENPRSVADLLLRIRDGDSADWDDAVRRYSNLVSATVRTFRLQDADARDAVQMTWLRLAENAHRVEWSERLAGWLATTARRECLRILRQAKRAPGTIETVAETVVDPSVGPEQRLVEAEVARTLWDLVEELPSRQRALLRALFSDHPRPYAETARLAGIAPGAIGPTRARALQQLRRRLNECGLGPGADVAEDVEGGPAEGDRTGSHDLDDLLDKAEKGLREKLEPKVTDLGTGSSQGTVDAQLDDLLHRADAALRATVLHGHQGTVDLCSRLASASIEVTIVTEVRPGGRRRIDRVLDPGYVADLGGLALNEVRARRDDAAQEETDLSYLRRLLHARIDIVRAEQQRRREGGSAPVVAELARILAANAVGPAIGSGRFQTLEPSRAEAHRRTVEALVANVDLSDVGSLSGEQLDGALQDYRTEEASVSQRRHEVQHVVDTFNAEIGSRYASGVASVDDLLASKRRLTGSGDQEH